MPVITCQEHRIESSGIPLLESLEHAGIPIPASCRTGRCQSCLVQLKNGCIPPAAQRGLSDRQRELNYFLACQCSPESDIEIDLLDNSCLRTAILVDKRLLNKRVLRARFRADVDWRAGQYLTLWRSEREGRVYSIASRPDEGFLELHVRRRNGCVSGWLEHQLQVGDRCQINLPRGDCYYSPAMPRQPVILIGLGTGLAPVYGVLKQALADGHHGAITVYVAAKTPSQFYLLDELEALCQQHEALHLVAVARRCATDRADVCEADLAELIAQRHAHLRGHLIYLCGQPAIVKRLYQQCFMRGAHTSDIFCDPFDYT